MRRWYHLSLDLTDQIRKRRVTTYAVRFFRIFLLSMPVSLVQLRVWGSHSHGETPDHTSIARGWRLFDALISLGSLANRRKYTFTKHCMVRSGMPTHCWRLMVGSGHVAGHVFVPSSSIPYDLQALPTELCVSYLETKLD